MNNKRGLPYLNIFFCITILFSISCGPKQKPEEEIVITNDTEAANENIIPVKDSGSVKVASSEKPLVLNAENTDTGTLADAQKDVSNLQLQHLQSDIKVKDAKISELQNQLKTQQNSNVEKQLQSDLIEKEAKIIQLQNQLKTQQSLKPDKQLQSDLIEKEAKITQLQNQLKMQQGPKPDKQLQSDLIEKEAKITQLKNQLKSQQSQNPDKKHSDEYDQLVKENKYLNFDVRSIIKSNLVLTKEFDALKKTNQDLNNQIRELKKLH